MKSHPEWMEMKEEIFPLGPEASKQAFGMLIRDSVNMFYVVFLFGFSLMTKKIHSNIVEPLVLAAFLDLFIIHPHSNHPLQNTLALGFP